MRSLITLGAAVISFGCGWVAWKAMEPEYRRAREIGGPQWIKTERNTVLCVIAAALLGGGIITLLLTMADR